MSRPTSNLDPDLEKEKLKADGSNLPVWFRTLKTLLDSLNLSYVLESALGDPPAKSATMDEKNVYQSRADDFSLVQTGMLYAMEHELQKRFEKMSAYEIITALKADFAPKAMVARYTTFELFMTTTMEEHDSIVEHVAKMSDYIQRLIAQGPEIPDELVIDRVLHSLPPSYHEFVMDFLTQEVPNLCLSYLRC